MVAKLLPLLEQYPHRTYVEAFGGGASLLFAKEPSAVEVYNDLDSGLVNLFRVLRDEEQFERFYWLVQLTPCSREEWRDCRERYEQTTDPVERAYRFYVVARQSFSGLWGSSWSMSVTTSRRGMAIATSKWLGTIEGLPEIHARLMRVQIEHDDWRRVLGTYDTPETLFYLDPPYVPETRSNKRYRHEMTIEDHTELVERLLNLQGWAILSGYGHPVYAPLEEAWRRVEWQTSCFAAGRTRASRLQGKGAALQKQPRTEVVWMSPLEAQRRVAWAQEQVQSARQLELTMIGREGSA
jgi:DNA adenine methylase